MPSARGHPLQEQMKNAQSIGFLSELQSNWYGLEFNATKQMIAMAVTFLLTTSLLLNRATAGLSKSQAWQVPNTIHPVLSL